MKTSTKFGALLMSNAKWRKFFRVVAEHSDDASTAVWKLIDEAEPIVGHLLSQSDVWETAVDNCLNGPVEYAEIEWIEIPAVVPYQRYRDAPLSHRAQQLERLKNAVAELGQFPVTETDEGLRVYGYRRQAT